MDRKKLSMTLSGELKGSEPPGRIHARNRRRILSGHLEHTE
jgi:hypothetical protein